MAAQVIRQITLLVISLIVAVISLPMTAAAISMPTWAKPLGIIGSEVLRVPIRAALAADGAIYVSDPRQGGIMKYSPAGLLLKRIVTTGVPQSVAVMSDGNLVVTISEFGHSYAAIVDSVSGLEIKRLKGSDGQEQHFGFADGVAVDDGVGAAGSIYVVDGKALLVYKFGLDGAYKSQFTVRGAPDGTSSLAGVPTTIPTFVAYEKESGLLAVVDKTVIGDSTARCIRFYTKDGVYVRGIGVNGPAGPMVFSSPQSVSFQYNPNGTLKRMYVVDTFNSTVQIIDPAGVSNPNSTPVFLGFMGDFGLNATSGELYLPGDAVYDSVTKRLAVVNGYGNIVYYGVDGGVNPAPVSVNPPVLTMVQPLSIVSLPDLSISGTVTAGSSVSCVLNNVPVASWKSDGVTTNWSCNLAGLSANNEIKVVAQNNSPVTDTKTATVKYVVGGPQIAIDDFPYYVKTATVALGGTTDATSLSVCNPSPGNCVSANIVGSRWDVSALPLNSGANNAITVEAVKNAVPVSQPVHGIVLDTNAPTLRISSVANNATVTDQIQNVTGKVSDPENLLEGVYVNSFDDLGNLLSTKTASVSSKGIFSIPMVGVTSYNVLAKDLAGNITTIPATGTYRINYDPSKIRIKVTSSFNDGSVVTVLSGLQLDGILDTANAVDGYSLTVNGVLADVTPATKSWTVRFPLVDPSVNEGLNDIQLIGSDGARTKVTMIYDNANPEATIVEPTADTATKNPTYTLKAMDGTAVILTVTSQGVTFPVASLAPFNVSFTEEGVYPIILKANDSNGAASQVVRNMIYDKTPPLVGFPSKYSSIVGSYPNFVANAGCTNGVCNQSSFAGVIEAGASVHVYDGAGNQLDNPANPVIYSDAGRAWSQALLSSRDPYDTVIAVTDAAGNIKRTSQAHPDGNMVIDAAFNTDDVTFCVNTVSAYGPSVPAGPNLSFNALAHGDVAPLLNGNINPDGYLDIVDCIMISRKLNGMVVPF